MKSCERAHHHLPRKSVLVLQTYGCMAGEQSEAGRDLLALFWIEGRNRKGTKSRQCSQLKPRITVNLNGRFVGVCKQNLGIVGRKRKDGTSESRERLDLFARGGLHRPNGCIALRHPFKDRFV